MRLFKKKHNSQFLKNCDTDWNLNIEFVHWLGYHCREYLKKADTIVNLDFHKIKYRGIELTQREAIEHLIAFCDDFFYFAPNEDEISKQQTVDNIFELFHELFWYMWW